MDLKEEITHMEPGLRTCTRAGDACERHTFDASNARRTHAQKLVASTPAGQQHPINRIIVTQTRDEQRRLHASDLSRTGTRVPGSRRASNAGGSAITALKRSAVSSARTAAICCCEFACEASYPGASREIVAALTL